MLNIDHKKDLTITYSAPRLDSLRVDWVQHSTAQPILFLVPCCCAMQFSKFPKVSTLASKSLEIWQRCFLLKAIESKSLSLIDHPI
jgi:hypothetical protein